MSQGGRYVYCVAEKSKSISFGKIGLEKNRVYSIPSNGLSAIVHNCKPKPYVSKEEKIVKEWVKTHQNVIDAVSEKLGTVIPFSFDVIIKGKQADKKVEEWLEKENNVLKNCLEKLRGKQEYGVQVFWDTKIIGNVAMQKNPRIKKMASEVETVSEGKAYFLKQKIKTELKNHVENYADYYFKKFYKSVKGHCDNIKIDKNKKFPGEQQMLMNLSCLVKSEKVAELGKELDKINRLNGFSVRFTGPWPAYSFVTGV